MNRKYERGEVIDVDLGAPPNEVRGHEQGFQRPCVIIKSFPEPGLAIVIPYTSKKPKFNYYTIVALEPGAGGLPVQSFALCHQIRTISSKRISARREKLDNRTYLKVKAVLQDTLEM